MPGISIVHTLGSTDCVVNVNVYFHAHNRFYPRGDEKFSKKTEKSIRLYPSNHNN